MNRKTWLLLDDDPENLGGDGGVGIEDVTKISEGSEFDPVEVTDKTGTGGADNTKQVVKKQAESMTPEQIAEMADRVVARRMAASQPRQKEPELTQEQIDAVLNPVRVTREDMAELFGIEDPATISDKRLAKLQGMLQAAVKNSNSVSSAMLEHRMRKLMEEAGPMQQFFQQQQAERTTQAFFKAHPKLEKFPKFVAFAASKVDPHNADGSMKSFDQVGKDVANYVKDLLKESNIDIDAEDTSETGNTTQDTARAGAVPKMASMQQAGRSGAGAVKGGGKNNPDADIYT